jgi:hypothetical protein
VKHLLAPVVIVVLALTSTLIVLMAVWILPTVGGQDSVCQQNPYYSGCR